MGALLSIPWFRAEPILIPLPEIVPGFTAIPVQPFGLLVAIGVLLGWHVADRRARAIGVNPTVASDLVGHVLVTAFVFGHVLDAVFYHPEKVLSDWTYVFQIWNGLSSFGGFVGTVLGALIWRMRRGVSLIAVADAVAFSFPFGWIFGRSGCFVVHDHPGVPSDFFLAVADYRVCFDCPPGPARHDLGLYEVIWSACAIVLFLLLARAKRPRGFFLALVPIVYGPVRFALDFLRVGPEENGDVRYFGLTPGQYGSIVLVAAGVAVALWIRARPVTELPPAAQWPPPPPPEVPPDVPPETPAEGSAAEPSATDATVAADAPATETASPDAQDTDLKGESVPPSEDPPPDAA